MTQDAPTIVTRKKLIEVALPLDAINKASQHEKAIRHGHPSTLHLWWARRPLAAARAVIFAQMVDDPSANSDLFPTKDEQDTERQRLFGIIEELVRWENTTNEAVLERASEEIWKSWKRACDDNADHPHAKELFDRDRLPAFHDPFAGGGSLPLEAQRLGLEAHASDLNPVAVLINKAMIEIPPRFAENPPVNPDARAEKRLMEQTWRGARGLAEDVRYYGQWMRDEAENRIGHLYPKVLVTDEMAKVRPDLEPYVGRELTVIAWVWARTVKTPNPGFGDLEIPLVSTFVLSNKKGREAYVEPIFTTGDYRFTIRVGSPPESARKGTKAKGSGSPFVCLASGSPVSFEYIRSEAKAGRMGVRMMAIVAEGDRGRVYLEPSDDQESIARVSPPQDAPLTAMPERALGFRVQEYGMTRWRDLFTPRQLVALTTFSDLVVEAQERIRNDAISAGVHDDGIPLRNGGTGATGYAEAVGVYLAFALSKTANRSSTICTFKSGVQYPGDTFGRQALPMTWDYAESNAVSGPSGSFESMIGVVVAGLLSTSGIARAAGTATQADVIAEPPQRHLVVSTDPPYYDNIGYADLSDFFYVWLRRAIGSTFPDLLSTIAVPKDAELVATPFRHGSKHDAEQFFLTGMSQALERLAACAHPAAPTTIYYAFKQSESGKSGVTSTGWETFLDAAVRAGLSITATWPVRTERTARTRAIGSNALASSIVLACRTRPTTASSVTRREFQDALRTRFPKALADLQRSNIAPVDLAQASIGPGMAVFTGYREVLNADGSKMSVQEALALINATLDEVLAEQEGEFDADTRWAVTWSEQFGYDEGEYGVAEQLSKAKNTSVDGLVRAGIIESKRSAVRIFRPAELDEGWDPATDTRLTVWEMTQHLIRVLESGGESAAGELAAKLGGQAEAARDLAYRLYVVGERKRRTADALAYNGLVQSWPEIMRLARQQPATTATQSALALDGS